MDENKYENTIQLIIFLAEAINEGAYCNLSAQFIKQLASEVHNLKFCFEQNEKELNKLRGNR